MELSHYRKKEKKSFQYCTFWNVADKTCAAKPNKEAFVYYADSVSYYRATFKQIQDTTCKIAAILLHKFAWLEPKDRIAVLGANRPELLYAELASYRIGNPVVFLPSSVKNNRDLVDGLEITDCKLLIFEANSISNDDLDMLLEMNKSLKSAIVFGGNAESYVGEKVQLWDEVFDKQITLTDDMKKHVNKRFSEVQPEWEMAVYFTTGTVGQLKAVVWSHFAIVNNQLAFGERNDFNDSTKFLQERPVSNLASSLFAGSAFPSALCGINGVTTIVANLSPIVDNSSNPAVYNIIEIEEVTDIILFGYLLNDFVTAPHYIKKKLTSIVSAKVGGKVLNQESILLLRKVLPNIQIMEGYGCTETGVLALQESNTSSGYTGRPLDLFEIKVIDSHGVIASVGEPGELICRGPTLMMGYLTKDGLVSGKDTAGWFHSDDTVKMNSKGEIVTMPDVIKRGGVIISPAFIENVLIEHPKVHEVQVVGVSDPRYSQEICACIVPTLPLSENKLIWGGVCTQRWEEDLLDWCEARFKADAKNGMRFSPRFYYLLQKMPRLDSGKVDKSMLKEMSEDIVREKFIAFLSRHRVSLAW